MDCFRGCFGGKRNAGVRFNPPATIPQSENPNRFVYPVFSSFDEEPVMLGKEIDHIEYDEQDLLRRNQVQTNGATDLDLSKVVNLSSDERSCLLGDIFSAELDPFSIDFLGRISIQLNAINDSGRITNLEGLYEQVYPEYCNQSGPRSESVKLLTHLKGELERTAPSQDLRQALIRVLCHIVAKVIEYKPKTTAQSHDAVVKRALSILDIRGEVPVADPRDSPPPDASYFARASIWTATL